MSLQINRRLLLGGGCAFALGACGSKFKTYRGPEVTRLQVFKDQRRMYLLNDRTILKAYDIKLGFTARGPKKFEGDGKTPEGTYVVDRRNPNSSYHLSLGISYPNDRDREYAAAMGKRPGGDIFIHGGPPKGHRQKRSKDWTAGCIAVKDRQIEDIFAMVALGTPIDIFA